MNGIAIELLIKCTFMESKEAGHYLLNAFNGIRYECEKTGNWMHDKTAFHVHGNVEFTFWLNYFMKLIVIHDR